MTDAAEMPPTALQKPRALWPWVLGTVVLLLGTLVFLFWWPMHRAGRFLALVDSDPEGVADVISEHPAWFEWIFGDEVFHPWFGRVESVSAGAAIVDDHFIRELAQFPELETIDLDVSRVSNAAMEEVIRLPSLEGASFQVIGSSNRLDWLAHATMDMRLLIKRRELTAADWQALSNCRASVDLILIACDLGDEGAMRLPERTVGVYLENCYLPRAFGGTLSRLSSLKQIACDACRTEPGFWRLLGDSSASFGLYLFNVSLTDETVGELEEIQSTSGFGISFRRGTLDDEAIRRLGRLRNLTRLTFSESTVPDGDAWESLTQLERLFYLDLSGTNVGDLTVAILARIPNLDHLDLSYTKITETGLRSLESSTSLKDLYVSGTALTLTEIKAARLRRPDLEIIAPRQEQLINAGETDDGAESEP